jgi:hypothetical protein
VEAKVREVQAKVDQNRASRVSSGNNTFWLLTIPSTCRRISLMWRSMSWNAILLSMSQVSQTLRNTSIRRHELMLRKPSLDSVVDRTRHTREPMMDIRDEHRP